MISGGWCQHPPVSRSPSPPVASQQALWLTSDHGDSICLVPSKVSLLSALSALDTTCTLALWGQLDPRNVFWHVWLPESVEE